MGQRPIAPLLVLGMLVACGGGGGGGGMSGPTISVNPGGVTFADQQLGSTSPATVVTVSNSGSGPLIVSQVQLTGANAAAFGQSNDCGTVAAGGSCTILVMFSPTASGAASATLTIMSSGSPGTLPVMLSGQGVTTATWTTLANAPPAGVALCLLMTDATVLCQSERDWYRLTPSITGSYVEGLWSLYTSFPSSYVPDDYASAVLADGRLVIVGGEYVLSGSQWSFTLSNMGLIFDPVANSWTSLTPPASTGSPNHWQCIGDAPAVILADGRLVIGSKLYQDVAVLDPATLAWSPVSAPGKSDAINSEEGWTLLPDGSVLAVNVSSPPFAERLTIAPGATSGSWVSAGETPVDLHTASTSPVLNAPGCPPYSPPGEMGPALLLPNGTVFQVGANGGTAIYSPGTNTWTAGPTVPGGLNIQDGPAVLLPSGHVLFGASPGSSGSGVQYFEFDGTQLLTAPLPVRANSDSSSDTSLLPLPTGQVLFVDGGTLVEVYSPDLSQTYDPAWAPTITSAPTTIAAGMTYQISGTQFNGLSQASAYGDEQQNATNYPLVRITNSSTGHVFYARTHDHSTMAVATGSAIVSTHFDVPASIEVGPATLQVVANGIPSAGTSVTVN